MINKLYSVLSKPFMVIIVMIVAPILSIADRNYGYFLVFLSHYFSYGKVVGIGQNLDLGKGYV